MLGSGLFFIIAGLRGLRARRLLIKSGLISSAYDTNLRGKLAKWVGLVWIIAGSLMLMAAVLFFITVPGSLLIFLAASAMQIFSRFYATGSDS
jgi:hypothetical protein